MIKIVNKFIPFGDFIALNFCGILFINKRFAHEVDKYVINHERIHTEQCKDLLYVGFYAIYILEWLYRLLFTKDRFDTLNAYRHISFEEEAYKHQMDLEYINTRKRFAMWR